MPENASRIASSVAAVLAGAIALFAAPASAQVPATGQFVAEARCPATRAIRDEPATANPGGIATEPGRTYKLVGRNADPATHYQILVPGADPERRWVAVGCGRVEADSTLSAETRSPLRLVQSGGMRGGAGGRETGGEPPGEPGQVENLVLAVTWPPAFCELNPDTPECRQPFETRGAALRFTLHGLWPQPYGTFYCGISAAAESRDRSGAWRMLEPVELAKNLQDRLKRAMPGTASDLDRHEWVKHGSCYGTDADDYFSDSLKLLDAINRSAVRALFAGNVSQYIGDWQIKRAFDQTFGEGAGSRVELVCEKDGFRTIITELRINLSGTIEPDSNVGGLIRSAPPAENDCGGGEVDAIGTQY